MSVLCVNICRLCVPNVMSLEIRFVKNFTSSKLARLLDTASKFALFLASSLKDKKFTKKQTYTKSETCKPYSGVLWIFVPNIIKIDPYNFELYGFKVGAFFWDTVYCEVCSCSSEIRSLSDKLFISVFQFQFGSATSFLDASTNTNTN